MSNENNQEKIKAFLENSLLFMNSGKNNHYINLKTGKVYRAGMNNLEILFFNQERGTYYNPNSHKFSYDNKLYTYLKYEEKKYLNELKELGIENESIEENIKNEKKSGPRI